MCKNNTKFFGVILLFFTLYGFLTKLVMFSTSFDISENEPSPLRTGRDKKTSEVVNCLSYEATKKDLCVSWGLGVYF